MAFAKGCLGAALLALGCGSAPPDLVLVTYDTLRLDHVGAYAPRDTSLTPAFDAVAKQGRLFENAFTTMPTTAPAHASILTGLHPREHGVERNGDRVSAEVSAASLVERLRGAGYATGGFVTTHVFRDAMGFGGLDRWDAPEGPFRPGPEAARAALAWIDGVERPFFLWLHLYDPHSPYGPSAGKLAEYPIDLSRYGWVEPERYRDPRARFQMTYLYGRGVQDADQGLAVLLSGLAERSLAPWLVLTADHGELFDEQLEATGFAYGHGALLTPEVLRVPLAIAGPGVAPARVATPVSLRDLYPTLLRLAGLRDEGAAAAGRLDLLGPLPEARVVEASRRSHDDDERGRRAGAAAARQQRAHAVAVSDGARLLVVGLDGEPLPGAPDDPALRDAAQRALAAELARRGERVAAPLDERTRRELEALGYVE